MLFLSKEWAESLAQMLKTDEKYQRKGKGFDSTYQMIALPCPEKGVSATRACGFLLPTVTDVWEGIREDVDYTMTASYDVFHQIFKGKLGPMVAVTTGKAKIAGSLTKMMRYTAATNLFVNTMMKVDTQFEGDFD